MVGTAPQRCTPSDSMRSSTCSGSNRPVLNTMRPPVMVWVSRVAKAPIWNSGVQIRFTGCGASGSSRCGNCRDLASTLCWLATTARNDNSTALGMPELPEVNSTTAGSSSASGPGIRGGVPDAVAPSARISAMSSTATPSAAARSGASVITARGAVRAMEWAASCGLHQRLPSTGTAPSDQIAQSATTQSGLL